MNPISRPAMRCRNGISLIEVIACITILAIMMVPMSAVIRSSRQTVARTENPPLQTQLRDGTHWLHQLIQDNTLLNVHSDTLVIQLATGKVVKVYVNSSELVIDSGSDAVVLMSDVRRVAFGEINLPSDPSKVVGVKMAIEMTDPQTSTSVQLTTVVSLPTQL